jgi:hypothetical protein
MRKRLVSYGMMMISLGVKSTIILLDKLSIMSESLLESVGPTKKNEKGAI